jgi:mercuric ion binding protein
MSKARFWHGFLVALLAGLLLTAPVYAQETNPVYTLQADGLACPFCAYGIEKQLSAIEGVETVETEIKTGTVTITMQGGVTLAEEVAKKAVEKAGFTMRDFKHPGMDE